MIPSITPPTDNLYKFICLFGLTVFLFFSYNLSFVHDRLSKNHLQIENVKTSTQHFLLHCKTIQGKVNNERSLLAIRNADEITALERELQKIEQLVENAPEKHKTIISLRGNLTKAALSIERLTTRFWLYVLFLAIGIFMVVWGFRRWQLREQNARDAILKLDEAIKRKETQEMMKEEQ